MSSSLASLYRGDDLDLVMVGQRPRRPVAARQDLAVNRDGDALVLPGDALDELRDAGPGRDLALLAVNGDGHRSLPGVKGNHSAAGASPATRRATASSVAADSMIPLR